MSPPLLPISEDDQRLMRAAELGARKALRDIGLDDRDAAHDIRDLRSLLSAWKETKSGIWETVVKWGTVLLLASIAGWVAKAAFHWDLPK